VPVISSTPPDENRLDRHIGQPSKRAVRIVEDNVDERARRRLPVIELKHGPPGLTATVGSLRTGRNTVATIVTVYMPQYSARPNDRTNLRAANCLRPHSKCANELRYAH
jgi:hypothetical protein